MIDLLKSFKYAILGIIYCIKTQRNMRIHFLAGILILILAYIVQITRTEWIILCITVTLVLAAEMMNTAIEAVVDLYTKDYHPLAKIAKDVAAGAVLVTALNAVIIGFLVFYRYSDKILMLIKKVI